jgi:hypothetical protein
MFIPAALIVGSILAQQPRLQPKSEIASPPGERPSQKIVRIFGNHQHDSAALFKRAMNRNEWDAVNAINIAASSTYESAVAVNVLSMLHWGHEDVGIMTNYLRHVRSGLATDIEMLTNVMNHSELVGTREEARSLRDDMRAFDAYIAEMIATVSALPPAKPPEHTDSGRKQDIF